MNAVFEDKQQILLEKKEPPETRNLTWKGHKSYLTSGGK